MLTRAGVVFARLPVADYGTPSLPALAAMADRLAARLAKGASVHLHCAGGMGRSGLLACAVLGVEGAAPDQAMARVGEARGKPVPETDAQRALLRDHAASLQDRAGP